MVISAGVGKGVSGSSWGTIGKFPVVVKPEDRGWKGSLRAEILAYHLDRMLGLNLVTVAAPQVLNGVEYSIHAVIKNVQDSGLNFRDSGYQEVYPDIFVLDFLTRNSDRHHHNSLAHPFGNLVAIDNGRGGALVGRPEASPLWTSQYLKYPFVNLPSADIVNTIVGIDPQEFKTELMKFTTPEIAELVTQNLVILKNDFSGRAPKAGLPRPLSREARLARAEIRANAQELLALQEKWNQEQLRKKKEESQKFQVGIKKVLAAMVPSTQDHEYIENNGIKLSANGHALLGFISENIATLNAENVIHLLETFQVLEEEHKIGEREVRRLAAYLLRQVAINEEVIKQLAWQMEVNSVYRALFDREDFREKFGEKMSETPQGVENFQMIMKQLPAYRAEGLSCRYLMLAY